MRSHRGQDVIAGLDLQGVRVAHNLIQKIARGLPPKPGLARGAAGLQEDASSVGDLTIEWPRRRQHIRNTIGCQARDP